MPMRPLAPLTAIEDGGSAAFETETDEGTRALMVIRRGYDVFVYVNRCPHVGLPLDFTPGRFLDRSGRHILCANHAALFRIEDGQCVTGPCVGQTLEAVPCAVDAQGMIVVTDDCDVE